MTIRIAIRLVLVALFPALFIVLGLPATVLSEDPPVNWEAVNDLLVETEFFYDLPRGWKSLGHGLSWQLAAPGERRYTVSISNIQKVAPPVKVLGDHNFHYQVPHPYAHAKMYYGYRCRYRGRDPQKYWKNFPKNGGSVLQYNLKLDKIRWSVSQFEKELGEVAARTEQRTSKGLFSGRTPPGSLKIGWNTFMQHATRDWNNPRLDRVWFSFSHIFSGDRGVIVTVSTDRAHLYQKRTRKKSGKSKSYTQHYEVQDSSMFGDQPGLPIPPMDLNRTEKDVRFLADLVESKLKHIARQYNELAVQDALQAVLASAAAGLAGLLGMGLFGAASGLFGGSGAAGTHSAQPSQPRKPVRLPFLEDLETLEREIQGREGRINTDAFGRNAFGQREAIEQMIRDTEVERDFVCTEERERVIDQHRLAINNAGRHLRVARNHREEKESEYSQVTSPLVSQWDDFSFIHRDFVKQEWPTSSAMGGWSKRIRVLVAFTEEKGKLIDRAMEVAMQQLSSEQDLKKIEQINMQVEGLKRQKESCQDAITGYDQLDADIKDAASQSQLSLTRVTAAENALKRVYAGRDEDLAQVDKKCQQLGNRLKNLEHLWKQADRNVIPVEKDLDWHTQVWDEYRQAKKALQDYMNSHSSDEKGYKKMVKKLAKAARKALNQVRQSQDYMTAQGEGEGGVFESYNDMPSRPADPAEPPYESYPEDVDYLNFLRDDLHRKKNNLASYLNHHRSFEKGYDGTVDQMKLDVKMAEDAIHRAEGFIWEQGGSVPNDPGPGSYGDPYAGDEVLVDFEREMQEHEKYRDGLENTLADIKKYAEKHGYDDILSHANVDAYNEDGSINPDYVNRLKRAMKGRLYREGQTALADLEPGAYTTAALDTFDSFRKNPLVRLGSGVLSGGTSEVFYQSAAAWDAMTAAADAQAKAGHDFGIVDGLRAGYKRFSEELIPLNTYRALKDPKASWTDVAGNLLLDAFITHEAAGTVLNLKGSLNAFRGGEGLWKGLTYRGNLGEFIGQKTGVYLTDPPSCEYIGGGSFYRNPDAMAPSTHMNHQNFGITGRNGRGMMMVAEKHGVDINVRPGNPHSLKYIEQGYPPKPEAIKCKTINEVDTLLGASQKDMGKVGYFKPVQPKRLPGMDDAHWDRIMGRYNQRMAEWGDQAEAINGMVSKGQIRVDENGVIINRTLNADPNTCDKAIVGDHDLLSITDPVTGKDIPENLKNQILDELRPFGVEHGAHSDWRAMLLNKSAGDLTPEQVAELNSKIGIYNAIAGKHELGGEALAAIRPGTSGPSTAYESLEKIILLK